nr:MAG TPA: hypothetical protein [Caudoviricetes sp.]
MISSIVIPSMISFNSSFFVICFHLQTFVLFF